eukprot:TRINITY_DN4296_c2_g1_i1.p1 TRINITY_DN4296_c2_g1~~TRINITY_DN4296_c2_g1_i1.p1  ORF type:complete len:152 (-),score=35.41 TRINITY_DN4296_c2_g1_i1:18-473(-)
MSGEGESPGFYCDWGEGNGSTCYDTNCEPCCGSPCEPAAGVKCVLCFALCGYCAMAEVYAHTLDQDCAVVNHCILLPFTLTCLRHNLRLMNNVGDGEGWIGDFLMAYCCMLCTLGQHLRTIDEPNLYLGWFDNLKEKGLNVVADDFKFVRE